MGIDFFHPDGADELLARAFLVGFPNASAPLLSRRIQEATFPLPLIATARPEGLAGNALA